MLSRCQEYSEKTPKICTAHVIPLPNKLTKEKSSKREEYLMMMGYFFTLWHYKNCLKVLPENVGDKFNSQFHMVYVVLMGIRLENAFGDPDRRQDHCRDPRYQFLK